MPHLADAFPALDARFAAHREAHGIPGSAWGVVHDGRLVHAAGAGTARDDAAASPDRTTIFRIASMTKSFTAAAILLLRDEGALRLEDPVAHHVPERAGWPLPTADLRPVTIRDLLTMSAGLATDDPWGDRQQALPLDAFARLLAAGPSFAWPSGTTYEYSNLGYGILGRVVTNAAGREYREVVEERILLPLGMGSTGYLAERLDPLRLAHGHARHDGTLVREGDDGYGALAAMGGLFSTVEDLAHWVAGFADAFPARDGDDARHPLARATRREQQQAHRLIGPEIDEHGPADEAAARAVAYGYGLVVTSDPGLGTLVGHSGGYPGFGSNMAWHPASGLGVVGLGNLRYAPMRAAVHGALADLVRAELVPVRRPRPVAALDGLRDAADRLVEAWDDELAARILAENVDLDEPRALRVAAIRAAVAAIGPLEEDPAAAPVEHPTPARARWRRRGARGELEIELLVTPEPAPRIQSLRVTAVPAPPPGLAAAAGSLLAAAATAATGGLPPEPALGPGVDAGLLVRDLTAAAARLGSMALGRVVASDGRTKATWELVTERGRARLRLAAGELDTAPGAVITIAELRIPGRGPLAEGW